MDDDALARLAGRAYDDPFPWRFLTELIEIGPRLGGSTGERRAAEHVAAAFEAATAGPELLPFDTRQWTRGDAELEIRAERDERVVERSFDAGARTSPGGE